MKASLKAIIIVTLLLASCSDETLQQVSVAEFRNFILQTNYITDAEKYGWSIVQNTVFEYEIVYGVNWECPIGHKYAEDKKPVTQISYNDAEAYAQWSHMKIPTYEEYWRLAEKDTKPINMNSPLILPINQCNIIGNVWEITEADDIGNVRLAGGSYLCNVNTCNGSSYDRELIVDKITGNSHIGLALIN